MNQTVKNSNLIHKLYPPKVKYTPGATQYRASVLDSVWVFKILKTFMFNHQKFLKFKREQGPGFFPSYNSHYDQAIYS